jgi:hypothetical protein
MTGLWLRLRIWIANRLIDLGMIDAAKKIAPHAMIAAQGRVIDGVRGWRLDGRDVGFGRRLSHAIQPSSPDLVCRGLVLRQRKT